MANAVDLTGLFSERFFKNFLPIPATNQFPLGIFAPPFELCHIQTRQWVRLSDYTAVHPVVLAFTRIFTERHYCPLCYPHIKAMNQAYEQFRQRGVEVLMISSTDALQSQIVIQDLGITMPFLSDPTCQVFRLYEVGQALGAPLPAQFIVDRSGRLRFRHLFSFLEPNASVERLLSALDTIDSL
ncbi:peroxiredoxin family protein [Thermocoleostomius sinensis]|jgi:peroxiredoxin|uniref:Peroxiredoxin family protein n=1 Tax=Thermocoleostomius sinensis A174 TaxID=2016057 RepID=A0A9E8ZFJ6_9CYAN|nr:peroxiredoxin family protein [Thermocoleostomius sinensis]WAL62455.1 peroxiredoxin family protein [Thermocoleostomius sinensis A174]